jgi:hypothetical protein
MGYKRMCIHDSEWKRVKIMNERDRCVSSTYPDNRKGYKTPRRPQNAVRDKREVKTGGACTIHSILFEGL